MRVRLQKGKQGELMKCVLKHTSQRKLAAKLKVSRRCVRNWLSGGNLLPLNVFNNLSETYNLNEFKKFIEGSLTDNWGQKKGGISRIAKVKNFDQFVKNLHENARKRAKEVKHINNITITTKFSKKVKQLKIDPLPILAVMLLTDGHLYKKRKSCEVGYASKDPELSKIFIEISKLWRKDIIISQYINKKHIIINYFHLPLENPLFYLSPSFKTSRYRTQIVSDYLKEPQPSLSFLMNAEENLKILCSRLALTNEGCITISFIKYKDKFILRPRLFLACAHPKLCGEWELIFSSLGLKLKKFKTKKSWSGISGIYTENLNTINKFYKLNGFIEKIKASSKSKYFQGVEKNFILSKCLKRMKFNSLEEARDYLKSGL